MVKKKKNRLERLLAKIEREYNIPLNEGNYQTRILEALESPPPLLDYFREYMKGDQITLEWGCLILLFIKANAERDVSDMERYYRFLKNYPANYLTEFTMADLELKYYGNLFKARDKLFKALELKPNDANCYYSLGLIYNLLGTFCKSIEHYENAVLHSQSSNTPAELKARSLYNIAAMKINLGQNFRDAERLLKEALKEMPDYDLARQALRTIRWER